MESQLLDETVILRQDLDISEVQRMMLNKVIKLRYEIPILAFIRSAICEGNEECTVEGTHSPKLILRSNGDLHLTVNQVIANLVPVPMPLRRTRNILHALELISQSIVVPLPHRVLAVNLWSGILDYLDVDSTVSTSSRWITMERNHMQHVRNHAQAATGSDEFALFELHKF